MEGSVVALALYTTYIHTNISPGQIHGIDFSVEGIVSPAIKIRYRNTKNRSD
jgi:hypothetical protein